MEKEKILYYNIIPTVVLVNSKINVDRYCNGFEVVNTGTTNMTVNGRPLYPGVPGTSNGDSISFGGNKGEIFGGRIDIAFTTGAGACIVSQKIYVPELDKDIQL